MAVVNHLKAITVIAVYKRMTDVFLSAEPFCARLLGTDVD